MKKTTMLFLLSIIVLFGCNSSQQTTNGNLNNSQWVYKGEDGKLVYKTTPLGDKIMDFSHAGYMGGGVAFPNVTVKKTVKPSGGEDDTDAIQAAIDEVAAMPIVGGFRGAVLLEPGIFSCSKTIEIKTNGIVLRGSGVNKTTIKMTGDKHSAVVISRGTERRSTENAATSETIITDAYVPFGSTSFSVSNASSFVVGDMIEIRRPTTEAWVTFMEMHNLKRDGNPQTWLPLTRRGIITRKITNVSGNKITIDVPVSDSYDAKYLNPPGTIVAKISPEPVVNQVGVEYLHFQCPPLEISYSQAPYSGIRIGGDDCWVRDVYFEETMNTCVITGKRVTLQKVVVTHTFTNLGASKPADFSFEGSQTLLDRCEAYGGNTYFVWTSSLISGPNVVLNCTFKGHGSRIQPHQRWSTGMLVDNCSIPGGGIDYLNRGVAGSGHGWTMGWGVVWNSIASTYVIQQPPGVYNWAIGSIGERVKTARLFDSTPILPEGEFESHGTPVNLQSLYLAQLEERLGLQALKNIGYESNTLDMFNNKSVSPLPPQAADDDPVLGADLALHRPVNTNNIRNKAREFGGEKALDANNNTYWAVDDGVLPVTFEVDTEGPLDINAIIIEEAEGFLNRVTEYKVEGQVNSDWKLLSQGTSIGAKKVDQFPKETVWKVKFTILKSEGYPAIRKFGIYLK